MGEYKHTFWILAHTLLWFLMKANQKENKKYELILLVSILDCPHGRRTGVPLITTDDALPW